MNQFTYISKSVVHTEALGAALAAAVTPGAVVALDGPLGAGKTRLVRAWARALGVDERIVASPTFVLCHEYHGRLTMHHFDAYRAKSAAEFWDLGIDEYYESGGIVVIEWASRIPECLPPERLEIAIEVTGQEERRFTMTAIGALYEEMLAHLRRALATSGNIAESRRHA